MPLFIYVGHDGAQGLRRRPEARPKHLEHLRGLSEQGRVRFAGPLLDELGDPRGSLILFEAPDLAAAKQIAETDPYLTLGVFERVEVHATKQVLPADGGA